MRLFYISKNYRDRFTASSKAKMDCERIVSKFGFRNIGLPMSGFQNRSFGRLWTYLSNKLALLRMCKGGIAFLQYPVYGYLDQVRKCIEKKNRVITIIHDLNILRGIENYSNIKILELSDVLIVHTLQMKEWCLSNLKVKNIVVLELFDYLYDNDNEFVIPYYDRNKKTVAFAGNLGKSNFLNEVQFDKIQLNLFGVGVEKLRLKNGCLYNGCFPPNELYKYLNSMFGLVWDGETINGCSGIGGEYLKYIIPHKLSMYLSCGIPVIVWSKSAVSDFVNKEKIGISVDSISEIESRVENISFEDYNFMCNRVMSVMSNVRSGYYLERAVKESLKIIDK